MGHDPCSHLFELIFSLSVFPCFKAAELLQLSEMQYAGYLYKAASRGNRKRVARRGAEAVLVSCWEKTLHAFTSNNQYQCSI